MVYVLLFVPVLLVLVVLSLAHADVTGLQYFFVFSVHKLQKSCPHVSGQLGHASHTCCDEKEGADNKMSMSCERLLPVLAVSAMES
jgi:hypothetical protein